MTQYITNQRIVDANRKALADGTLSALREYPHCAYSYGGGFRCAIGVTLDETSLRSVIDEGHNESPVGALMTSEIVQQSPIVKFEDPRVAVLTQILHDKWASLFGKSTISSMSGDDVIADFRRKKNIPEDTPINRELFEKWLDYVESERIV